MQNHFDTEPEIMLQCKPSTSLNTDHSGAISPTKDYSNRPSERVGPTCGRLIDFPLGYVEQEEEEEEEEGAGAEMEDWKVGGEIKWSHYVAVCYLGWWSSRESVCR